MKSSILRAGVVALACALGLSACGGGSGDLYLTGAVYNVTKDGLVLTNNGEDLAVTTPYTSFQFNNRISTDDQFNITVKSVPSNVEKVSDCVVNNGKARANYYTIAQISVTCTIRKRALTATINNLTGSGLVLINGADKQTVAAGTTSVKMSPVNEDGPYGVTVLTQPTGQTCTVSGGSSGNGSGIMGATETTTVTVTCA
ncbi:hypothetical protein IA69_14650 [Massilia sp. JS1662]|nr:hypothetical protein [Massilia sp. JS1662]KGF81013.1 hypothetical protein IA69_14650 [Massilia sp. JS1662]